MTTLKGFDARRWLTKLDHTKLARVELEAVAFPPPRPLPGQTRSLPVRLLVWARAVKREATP